MLKPGFFRDLAAENPRKSGYRILVLFGRGRKVGVAEKKGFAHMELANNVQKFSKKMCTSMVKQKQKVKKKQKPHGYSIYFSNFTCNDH